MLDGMLDGMLDARPAQWGSARHLPMCVLPRIERTSEGLVPDVSLHNLSWSRLPEANRELHETQR